MCRELAPVKNGRFDYHLYRYVGGVKECWGVGMAARTQGRA